jgi:CheY-like chemotaxis protein
MALNLSKINILLVEDNDAIGQICKHVLETLGVGKVDIAKDGEEGFEKFKTFSQDIIISDWEMDPVTGPEFLEKVRQSPDSPNRTVPFIMLTGYASSKKVLQARDTGATEFIVKPFTAEQIAKRLSQVINRPRNFVQSPDFTGPDRRRKHDPNYTKVERRTNRWKTS